MYRTTLTPKPRRSLLAPMTVWAPAALLLALAIPAMAIPISYASPIQAAMQAITIKASAPQLPKNLTTGLVSVTVINDTKSEVDAGFGQANAGATEAQIKAAVTGADSNSVSGFLQMLKLVTLLGGPDAVLPGASENGLVRLDAPGLYGLHLGSNNGPSKLIFFSVAAGGGASTPLPAADVAVTLKDFKFAGLPKHLAAGHVSFQFINTGRQAHELSLLRLDSGKTQKDVLALLRSPQGQNGPPPAWAHDAAGVDVLSPHQSTEVTFSLTPGYYVALCFMPDPNKNGEPHVMEGMIGSFTVS